MRDHLTLCVLKVRVPYGGHVHLWGHVIYIYIYVCVCVCVYTEDSDRIRGEPEGSLFNRSYTEV